jgi:hypothetical protein
MTRVNFKVGDELVIRVGDDVGIYRVIHIGDHPALQRVTPTCRACNSNEAYVEDGWDGFCPGCVAKAMRWVALRDAVNHLVDNDDEIRAVVEYDNNEQIRSRNGGYQYIDLQSSAHDQYAGMSGELIMDELRDCLNAISGVMSSGTLYGMR